MAKYLQLAKAHLHELEYEILETIKDSEGCEMALLVKRKNTNSILFAFQNFLLRKGIGICKSVDVELIHKAFDDELEILFYVDEPKPEIYFISANKIGKWINESSPLIEMFSKLKGCEDRKKYSEIPLKTLGLKNINDREKKPFMNKWF